MHTKDRIVRFRATPEMHEAIRELADERLTTMSDLIRRAVLRDQTLQEMIDELRAQEDGTEGDGAAN